MIVADSSVWIAVFRGETSPQTDFFREAAENRNILVGDIILLEVLQGARDDRHAAFIERNMRRFEIATMLDAPLGVKAAANYRRLRSLGITVRKTADLIIATFCIENGHHVMHRDRDYSHFTRYFGLRVA